MAAHSYTLRSRVSNSSLSSRTGSQSPLQKSIKSPRKEPSSTSSLQLKHVIGTTATTPSGLSCCEANASFAYTAGSVAVLASVDHNNVVSYRYFKARPTTLPINPINSFYDSPVTSTTPTRRRTTFVSSRGHDNLGSGSVRDWSDDGAGQTWSARERIKAAACVSISPDGKILAVGESGYNPRVLLFSTSATMPSDIPLSVITDHTVGVRSVAFSPNSEYLATLGDVNDGFLYIWQVNTKTGVVKLQSSNKCTTNICDMTWVGNNVVTVGTRHVKIWQASSGGNHIPSRRARVMNDGDVFCSSPTPLQGRNCLLGPLVDATFTAIVAVSHNQAVVCADDGNICLLDTRQTKAELLPVEKTDLSVTAISFRRDAFRLVWLSTGGVLEERDLGALRSKEEVQQKASKPVDGDRRRKTSRKSSLYQSLGISPPKRASIVALNCLGEKAICVDADGTVRVFKIDTGDLEPDVCQISSHNGSVRGVQSLPGKAGLGSFYTWAKCGEVRCWDASGKLLRSGMVDLDENLDMNDAVGNELKVVRYLQGCNMFVAGDQLGVLKLIDHTSWRCFQDVRAHSAEINGIDICEPRSLAATCSRDRTVQIFMVLDGRFELLQTSDDHISSVSQVLFSHDGDRLLSASADRTVVVRERVERDLQHKVVSAFIPTRTVTLKSAPLSMGILPVQPNNLVLSTMDRHVVKVDLATGATTGTFKVSDPDSEDTVFLNAMSLGSSGPRNDKCLLAGYSSIDKSVRVYDVEKGVLLNRDAGHTEGISDILMFEDVTAETTSTQHTIVSTGLDGTIMIWSVTNGGKPTLAPQQVWLQSPSSSDNEPHKLLRTASPASLPPLRKILSKMDFVNLTRQTSPARERSPNGLRRKASRLALASSIKETDESSAPKTTRSRSLEQDMVVERASRSPPKEADLKPMKQRPQLVAEDLDVLGSTLGQPFSLQAHSASVLTTPKYNTMANNSRLRRPPSVPTDLRVQTIADTRRQSVSSTSGLVSISMATEQACRVLKSYKKKLQASKGEPDLDEIETDLEALLNTIRLKRARLTEHVNDQTSAMKSLDNNGVNDLTVMLAKTKVS